MSSLKEQIAELLIVRHLDPALEGGAALRALLSYEAALGAHEANDRLARIRKALPPGRTELLRMILEAHDNLHDFQDELRVYTACFEESPAEPTETERKATAFDWLASRPGLKRTVTVFANGHTQINPNGEPCNWKVGDTLLEACEAAMKETK